MSTTAGPGTTPSRPAFLVFLAAASFLSLLLMTVYASSVRGILDNGHLMSDAWFQVTLLDAYLGFLLFFAWLWCQESGWPARGFWFVAIMIFGNMATSVYVMVFLLRRRSAENGDRPAAESAAA
ncbi:MAG: DUF1475 domain-containing protein [Planctomycetaceae bacterium]|nr:DUF1475 domain-containing protein [Planctomycetaceae bacterium]